MCGDNWLMFVFRLPDVNLIMVFDCVLDFVRKMCELIVFFVVRGLLIYLDIDLKVDSRTFFLL